MGSEYTINVDDCAPYQVHVGGHLTLTVHLRDGTIHSEWEEEWKNWEELQQHAKLVALNEKCESVVRRSRLGMKGAGRGTGK